MSDRRVEALRRVPLFATCTDRQLGFIVTQVEELDFPAEKVLCVEGRSGGDFFVILEGAAEVTRDGRRIRELSAGDFFGEIALLDNGPRTASVRTTAPSRCLVLGPAQFQNVLHQNAEIALSVLHEVSRRLRNTGALEAD
ncbi:MAG: cyclic nucleotide-binding domain-containing protein [Candidatus Limnocylindria bacterium]